MRPSKMLVVDLIGSGVSSTAQLPRGLATLLVGRRLMSLESSPARPNSRAPLRSSVRALPSTSHSGEMRFSALTPNAVRLILSSTSEPATPGSATRKLAVAQAAGMGGLSIRRMTGLVVPMPVMPVWMT